jgi:hypothetical protein
MLSNRSSNVSVDVCCMIEPERKNSRNIKETTDMDVNVGIVCLECTVGTRADEELLRN